MVEGRLVDGLCDGNVYSNTFCLFLSTKNFFLYRIPSLSLNNEAQRNLAAAPFVGEITANP